VATSPLLLPKRLSKREELFSCVPAGSPVAPVKRRHRHILALREGNKMEEIFPNWPAHLANRMPKVAAKSAACEQK